MKFSIAIVVYNDAENLRKTLYSIARQQYSDCEVVIIDGESSDNPEQVISQFPYLHVQYKSECDKGIYDAMNKALKIAKGDFLIFMGAGDCFFDDNVLCSIAQKILNANLIYYGDVLLGKNGKRIWGKYTKYKLACGNICHQSIFYPKTVYKTHEYNLSYRVYADYVYNLNLYGSFEFSHISTIISIYDMDGFSSTAKDLNFSRDRAHLVITRLGILPYIYGVIYRFLLKIKKFFL